MMNRDIPVSIEEGFFWVTMVTWVCDKSYRHKKGKQNKIKQGIPDSNNMRIENDSVRGESGERFEKSAKPSP